jgi:hypothetical protein
MVLESEFWPPVLEYTCVSSMSIFTLGRFWSTTFETFWKPMSPSAPSPPMTQTFGSSRISCSVMSASSRRVSVKYSASVATFSVRSSSASAMRSGATERRAWSTMIDSAMSHEIVAPSWKSEFIHGYGCGFEGGVEPYTVLHPVLAPIIITDMPFARRPSMA